EAHLDTRGDAALFGEANEVINGAAGGGGGANGRALEVEADGEGVPTTVLFAHHLARGNTDIFEEHFVEFVCAGHVDERADGDARRIHLDAEHRDALVLGSRGVGAAGKPAPV